MLQKANHDFEVQNVCPLSMRNAYVIAFLFYFIFNYVFFFLCYMFLHNANTSVATAHTPDLSILMFLFFLVSFVI